MGKSHSEKSVIEIIDTYDETNNSAGTIVSIKTVPS